MDDDVAANRRLLIRRSFHLKEPQRTLSAAIESVCVYFKDWRMLLLVCQAAEGLCVIVTVCWFAGTLSVGCLKFSLRV